MRNFLAILLMGFGPFLVWLIYAHFFRDLGGNREWQGAVLIGLAMVVGSVGALALGSPFNRWALLAKAGGYVAYGTAMAFAMPFIALFAVCTTGDCL